MYVEMKVSGDSGPALIGSADGLRSVDASTGAVKWDAPTAWQSNVGPPLEAFIRTFNTKSAAFVRSTTDRNGQGATSVTIADTRTGAASVAIELPLFTLAAIVADDHLLLVGRVANPDRPGAYIGGIISVTA